MADTSLYGSAIIHPDDRDDVWSTVQRALERRNAFETTYRIVTADGDTKWVWERGQEVATTDGGPTVLEGFITDITDRDPATTDRQGAQNPPTEDLTAEDTVCYILTPDGRLQHWNTDSTNVTGYSDAELASMHARELFPGGQHAALERALEQTLVTGSAVADLDLRTADGDRRPYWFTAARLADGDRTPPASSASGVASTTASSRPPLEASGRVSRSDRSAQGCWRPFVARQGPTRVRSADAPSS